MADNDKRIIFQPELDLGTLISDSEKAKGLLLDLFKAAGTLGIAEKKRFVDSLGLIEQLQLKEQRLYDLRSKANSTEEISKFNTALKANQAQIVALTGTTQTETKKQASAFSALTGGITSQLGQLATAFAAFFTSQKLFQFIEDGIKLAVEENKAFAQTAFQLQQIAGYTDDVIEAFRKQAQQKAGSFFADADIAKAQLFLTQFGLIPLQVEKAIPIIEDFAVATGRSMQEATDAVVNAIKGRGFELRNYQIYTSASASATENFNNVITKLSEKFTDAQTGLDQTTLAAQRAKVGWEELSESIGETFLPAINNQLIAIDALQKKEISWVEFLFDSQDRLQKVIASRDALIAFVDKKTAEIAGAPGDITIASLKKQIADAEELNANLQTEYAKIISAPITLISDAQIAANIDIKTRLDESAKLIADLKLQLKGLKELDTPRDTHTPEEIAKALAAQLKRIRDLRASLLNDGQDKDIATAQAKANDLIGALMADPLTLAHRAEEIKLITENLAKDIAKIRLTYLDSSLKADAELEITEAKKNAEDLLQAKIDEIEVKRKIELDNTKLTEDERKNIIEKSEQEISDLQLTMALANLKAIADMALIEAGHDKDRIIAAKIQVLEAERDAELQNTIKTEDEKKLIVKKAEKEIADLKLQLIQDNATAIADIAVKTAPDDSKQLLAAEINQLQIEKEIKLKNTDLTESERKDIIVSYDKQISDLQDTFLKHQIDNAKSYTDIVIQSFTDILNAFVDLNDKQLDLQQRRVEAAALIAERGNAELLQAEQDKYNALLIKAEKYQKDLAVLAALQEAVNFALSISNIVAAISEAAATTGPAAPIIIPAVVAAIGAGIAAAAAIVKASQASSGFQEGGYTGDGDEQKQAGVVHKGEFVHTAKETGQNRDIHEAIHSGKLNLRQQVAKAKKYDDLTANINTKQMAQMVVVHSNNTTDMKRVESKLDKVIEAIQTQERLAVNITKSGIGIIASKYSSDIKKEKKLTS